ncbi:MAG: hypothetical protein N2C14_06555, partial [Planctomycetales bacterium]
MNRPALRQAVDDALNPARFVTRKENGVRVDQEPERTVPWEVFRGHLLEPRQATQERSFESRYVFLVRERTPSKHPVLMIKFNDAAVFVARVILVHGHEAHDDDRGMIVTRPVIKPQTELVGEIDPRTVDAKTLRGAVCELLFKAVVGISRLPVTSIESPLPEFSLGELFYLPSEISPTTPIHEPRDLIAAASARDMPLEHRAKVLEFALRVGTNEEVSGVADNLIGAALSPSGVPALLRAMFNDSSLSPHTEFLDRLPRLFDELTSREIVSEEAMIDVIGYMLRQLTRHLTGFDLTTFHNLGANYPDAIFLDALLKRFLDSIEAEPSRFENQAGDDEKLAARKRLRRRALRRAWCMRKRYEGHPVPEIPKSPGENARVLPKPFGKIPDEQLMNPRKRPKKLFENDASENLLAKRSRAILDQGVDDLQFDEELREHGTALFLDRPLGLIKERGEVDRTSLFSHESFSADLARQELDRLSEWEMLPPSRREEHAARLQQLQVVGMPVSELSVEDHFAVVSLEDARKMADDFVFTRTTRRSLNQFLDRHDFSVLNAHDENFETFLRSACKLLIRVAGRSDADIDQPWMIAFDQEMRPRLELALPLLEAGNVAYAQWAADEYLTDGLRPLRLWKQEENGELREIVLPDDLRVLPTSR